MDSQALIVVKEITNGLKTADSKEDILKWLTIIKALFVPRILSQTSSLHGYKCSTLLSVSGVITSKYAKRIYEYLIAQFSLEWVTKITTEVFNSLVLSIFLEGPPRDAFIILLNAVTENPNKNFAFYKCMVILEKFMCRSSLTQLLITMSSDDELRQFQTLNVDAEIVLGYLVSFAQKIANKLQHENSEIFLPQFYVPNLAMAILDTLQWAHDLLASSQNVSLFFVSCLVGKLCLTGYAELLLDTLLPHLCVRVRSDYIWPRICERVFSGVPDRCLEAVVVPLLKKITWYGLVEKFLGDCVVHNIGIRRLICTKLLLYRYYSKPKPLLYNIIGYLTSFHSRRHLFVEVLIKLLKVWGDKSSIKHISFEQHLYISRALMVCIGSLNEQEKVSSKDELLRHLVHGVGAHLESSDPNMRNLGMTVAETLASTLDPKGLKLEFELNVSDKLVKDLLSYPVLPPKDPVPSLKEEKVMGEMMAVSEKSSEETKSESSTLSSNQTPTNKEDELDSDDDLEPYDMSNDKKVTKTAPPKYIRDCMEGLICSSDNPDRTELCLQHAENLIRKKTVDLEEIAVEMAKILLHLENTHNFDNFHVNRFTALVALTAQCPHQVSDYLTGQFYERNYSLRQRMDILEVLSNAALELSTPEKQTQDRGKKPLPAYSPSDSSGWREVVQKRIDSNTRRFAKGRTQPEPTATLNKFAPVAGQFFYPLMAKADKSQSFLDLQGADTTLLFRLLYTLAAVLHSAINLPCSRRMGHTLLEFTLPLRFHPDSCVRQAVLMCTITVLIVVPHHFLMTDMTSDFEETISWLTGITDHDPDTECQKYASQALTILTQQMKKDLETNK